MHIEINCLPREKKDPHRLLGVDITPHEIRIVQVKQIDDYLVLDICDSEPLDVHTIVDGHLTLPNNVTASLITLLNRNQTANRNVAICLSGHSAVTKYILLDAPTAEDDEAFKSVAEEYSPYPPDQTLFDKFITHSPDDKYHDAIFVAIKKFSAESYVEAVTAAGCRVRVVDTRCLTLHNMFEGTHLTQAEDIVALVDVQADVISVVISKNGRSFFFRDIHMGTDLITEEIVKITGTDELRARETLKQYDPNNTDKLHTAEDKAIDAAYTRSIDTLTAEVQRCLDFFAATSVNHEITRIMLLGHGIRLPNFDKRLAKRADIKVTRCNPLEHIAWKKTVRADMTEDETANLQMWYKKVSELRPNLATAIGLALRYSP